MTDIAARIRARLAADRAYHYSAGVGAVEYRAAIRAVLDQHPTVPIYDGELGGPWWCGRCRQADTVSCSTKDAIADALGISDSLSAEDREWIAADSLADRTADAADRGAE